MYPKHYLTSTERTIMAKKHIQLPTDTLGNEVDPMALLTYVVMKRFENNRTHSTFVSKGKLAKILKTKPKQITKYLNQLQEEGYITITNVGKKRPKYVYFFNAYKSFEPFSYDFLDNEHLSVAEKAYIVASQQYMFKDKGLGTVELSDRELSKKIKLSRPTIAKLDKSLSEKGYLSKVPLYQIDTETKLPALCKVFQLDAFGQAVVFEITRLDAKTKEHDVLIANLQQQIADLQEVINNITKNP